MGNFSNPNITVNSGDNVTINFSLPANDPYCCGAIVKGNGGEFNTGVITKGQTKTVSFVANSSFTFTSTWPNGLVKATGSVTVNAPAPLPPASATNLQATAISTSQINLSWSAGSGATSYDIYRNGSLLTNVATLFFNDSSLSASTTYTYQVKSKGNGLESDFSNSASATTQTPAPVVDNSNNTQNQNNQTPVINNSNNQQTQDTQQQQQTVTPVTTDVKVSDTTPVSFPVSSPVVPATKQNNIFIDDQQSLVSVEGITYTYALTPKMEQGNSFLIFGRTEAFAQVSVLVESTPKLYSTIADKDGKWSINVDTKLLDIGNHKFTITLKSADTQKSADLTPINFEVTGPTFLNINTNIFPIILVGIAIIVIAIIVLIILRLRKNDRDFNNNGLPLPAPTQPMGIPQPLPAQNAIIQQDKVVTQQVVAPVQSSAPNIQPTPMLDSPFGAAANVQPAVGSVLPSPTQPVSQEMPTVTIPEA